MFTAKTFFFTEKTKKKIVIREAVNSYFTNWTVDLSSPKTWSLGKVGCNLVHFQPFLVPLIPFRKKINI